MKAACYCGTRNLYKDMIPAVNSLLKNSDVDKVYLLIEDDVFPYKMPECVETVNVKDQPYFTHNGPNFKNGWTFINQGKEIALSSALCSSSYKGEGMRVG